MFLVPTYLPLISFLVLCISGFRIGKNGARIFSTLCSFIMFITSCIAFFDVAIQKNTYYCLLGSWINCELFQVNWGFMFDSLSCTMLVIVNSVSFLVHLYSCGYMKDDPSIPRFMSYLSLFTFFMIVLVTADNFIVLFLGWEGVGLCSFLLISFWFTRVQAVKSAIKAIVVNRIGDFGLIIGVATCFTVFRSVDYQVIFGLVPFFIGKSITFCSVELEVLDIICFFLFIGAVGKSAQLGLHTWLPDAMEGPTPVSALIHAATMVTAGVFLIIRCSPIFEYSPNILTMVLLIGSLTSFFAATVGVVQNDIKKVIAYSTCSQLGYMFSACGLSGYSISLFHLFNHAFFKALLFLSAGAIIHNLADEQDMRRMGGLVIPMKFSYAAMLIGSLSLAGFPFLSGFYSKDLILELAYSKYSVNATFSYWIGTFSAFLTSFYSFRLIYLVYLTKVNSFKYQITSFHNLDYTVFIPLVLLSFGSIFSGFLFKDIFVGVGTDVFDRSIFTLDTFSTSLLKAEFLPLHIKQIPTFFSLLGIFLSLYLNHYSAKFLFYIKVTHKYIYNFFVQKWYFDTIYSELVAKKIYNIGYSHTFKNIDKGLLEFLGPLGISYYIYILSKNIRLLFVDYIYNYFSLAIIMLLVVNFSIILLF